MYKKMADENSYSRLDHTEGSHDKNHLCFLHMFLVSYMFGSQLFSDVHKVISQVRYSGFSL